MNEVLYTAGAILTSLGGGALIVAAFSTWLGKVWASRILEKDKLKYQGEMEKIKSELNKKIHEHNVAVSRIDAQRADAIQKLYCCLVEWFEAALAIRAPNKLADGDAIDAISTYQEWAKPLRATSEKLEKISLLYTILLTEETYKKVAACGYTASMFSIEFCDVVFNNESLHPEEILNDIENARRKLEEKYIKDFEPAKEALINEFRTIMDPRINIEGKDS